MTYSQCLRYVWLAVLDLLFTNLVARALVNWWAPLFADKDGWLPDWLAWFQTFDASLDAGWRDGYFGDWTYREPMMAPTGFERYWFRVRWLYRNPAYGFSYWYLGTAFDPAQWTIVRWEQSPGRELFYAAGPDGTFNLTYYGRWGTYKLGWKAWNYFDPATGAWKPHYQWGPLMRVPCVFSPNPFRRQ